MITKIEDYFAKGCGRCARFDTPECSARGFAEGLGALREICLGAGLSEHVKWGHPTYMHAGRNIAVMGAFRAGFRLSFFNAALMQDPEGVLQKQGPNTQHPDMIAFTSAVEVAEKAEVIGAYLAEAMGYAEAGLKPPKETGTLDLPDTLIEALDADPDLAQAFYGLTRGRQKSYVIHLASAKTAETQIRRIAKARDKIFAGKGATER